MRSVLFPPWTKDRVAALTDLWTQGYSASMIADQMHVTRNAVIGKAHRLKLTARYPREAPIRRPRSLAGRARVAIKRLLGPDAPRPTPLVDLPTGPTFRLRSTMAAEMKARRRLPQPEMTKNELRRQFEEAWRNTAKKG